VRSIRPRRKLRDANAKGIADLAADILIFATNKAAAS
jgi:hypothetical protein